MNITATSPLFLNMRQACEELLPQRFYQLFGVERNIDLIDISNDEAWVIHKAGSIETQIPIVDKTKSEHLAALKENRSEIGVIIPDHVVIDQIITFPMAAKSNIEALISHEIEKITPFKQTDISFDYAVINEDKLSNRLHVLVFISPLKKVNEYLSEIKPYLHRPSLITTPSALEKNADINLLPLSLRNKSNKPYIRLNRILLILILILAIASSYAPTVKLTIENHYVERELAAMTTKVREVAKLKEQLNQAISNKSYVINKISRHTDVIDTLNSLTDIIPTTTWLSRLEYRSDQVILQGESSNSSEILNALENSTLFSSAKFTAPITKNEATLKDRFTISATIKASDQP